MNLKPFIIVSVLCLFFSPIFSHANEIGVSVDVKCNDSTLEYKILNATLNVLKTSPSYKKAPIGEADFMIRIAVSSIKDGGKIVGAAVAILAIKKNPTGPPKIINFGNEVVNLGDLEKRVQSSVNGFLK